MKRIIVFSLMSIFILSLTTLSWAMMCEKTKHLAQAQTATPEEITEVEKAVNVDNKICPVSGEKIDEKTKVTYEHEGKIYNLCCKACMKDFKKDPDKYIKKVEEELKKRAEQEKKAMPAPEMPEGISEGHHHTESHQEHQH